MSAYPIHSRAPRARRPYSDVCTRFVYEEGTDTCYFKAK